jgi:hypothetical protein
MRELPARRVRSSSKTSQSQAKTRRIPIDAPNDGEHPIVVEKDRARQGVTGHHVRYVLAFGLAAGVVALAAIYLFYFG